MYIYGDANFLAEGAEEHQENKPKVSLLQWHVLSNILLKYFLFFMYVKKKKKENQQHEFYGLFVCLIGWLFFWVVGG